MKPIHLALAASLLVACAQASAIQKTPPGLSIAELVTIAPSPATQSVEPLRPLPVPEPSPSAAIVPQSPPRLALAAPYRGKSSALGWRLAGMFVSGLEYSTADRDYSVYFLDAELPLHLALARHAAADRASPNTIVGPFQRARSDAWRPTLTEMEMSQVGFATREGSQPGARFTLALDPAANAAALANYLCHDSQTRLWSILVPQSSTGERFARSFALAAARCEGAVLSAATWYREDLEDLSVRAREHYGIDRVPLETLERQQRHMDSVEGILQSDVTLVIGSPDNLQRVLNELLYQGSSFQVFAGDFNFGHAKILSEVKWSVPPVFLDHYPRSRAITQSPSFENFVRSSQRFVKGQPTTADLLLYEAGQLAAQGAFVTPTEATYTAAGGILRGNTDGSFSLPMYPLSVSEGHIISAPTALLDSLVAKQKDQHQKFIQAREAARANKTKSSPAAP